LGRYAETGHPTLITLDRALAAKVNGAVLLGQDSLPPLS